MLTTLDRTADGRLSITQEFLAGLLGCTRSTVNGVLAEFEKANAIRTGRGTIDVVDRAPLEKFTCECYEIIRSTYQELEERKTHIRELRKDEFQVKDTEKRESHVG
jgi:DNA-binding transcriptional regulator YhcF (GntR family)